MADPAEAKATCGQLIAGRYELLEQLAVGGMGTVWSADDQKLGRRVALKVMRPRSLEAFDDAHQRFEREAKAAAALHSAHVVAVHDYGVDDDLPFIAMELLEGESLKQRLLREDMLPVQEASVLLRQVVKGLKVAHRAGLVHRDLKPSNIFLAQSDDAEVIKLLDFGVVKESEAPRREQDETASGVLLGTPQYMSPEQARGYREIDHRADLWSLAVIVYEMITGENPFDSEAEAVGDIVIRVCVEPITPPTVLEPDLPETLDAFFERALDRRPDGRFQSAGELYEAFLLAAELSMGGDISLDGMPSLPVSARPVVHESQSFERVQEADVEDPPSDDPEDSDDPDEPSSSQAATPAAPDGGRSHRSAALGLVAALGVGGLLASQLSPSEPKASAPGAIGTSSAPASRPGLPEPSNAAPVSAILEAPAASGDAPEKETPKPHPEASASSVRPVVPTPPVDPSGAAAPAPPPDPVDDPDRPPTWYPSPKPEGDGS